MIASNKWALFYTTIAVIMLVAGYITRLEIYLYVAVFLALISFYWMFRNKIVKYVRKKLHKTNTKP